ncbi:hypothetical protein [Pedobacter sp. SL55]|uniref:hypothetical protein n=1 Tax=Pedobacter sp. SL55 TaxID=2995161 RepID=UPI00227088D6|nr:hypothetical protein [Pedobacter sp. SL55]WAC42245.1 hypothetical protein OVA16_07785 [Pedobacter sp. SL55]
MQITSTIEVINQHAPTRADTLQKVVTSLQVKVDSLEKVVEKTEISTGFFSEIISLQLGVFALFVGAAGFFSWKWLQYKLEKIETDGKAHTDEKIKAVKDELVNEQNWLSNELMSIAYDVQRSMYFHTRNDDNKPASFQWSLSAFCTLYAYNPDDKEKLLFWAQNSVELLSKLQIGDLEPVKETPRLEEYLNIVFGIDDNDLKNIFKDFKTDIYHILYAKQQPPEDLIQDHLENIEEASVEN